MAMISAELGRLRETRPHEYAIRFLFGGLCTSCAGWIASHYGPGIGGLFLAFPAIFPAGATLIASHEEKRKAGGGMDGRARGMQAAALDASGAALGGFALIAYALFLWRELAGHAAVLMIGAATALWAIVSGLLWFGWKRRSMRSLQRRAARRDHMRPLHASRHETPPDTRRR